MAARKPRMSLAWIMPRRLPLPRKSIRQSRGSPYPPDTVKKFKALGVDIEIEPGAGIKSGLPDSEFTAVGATVSARRETFEVDTLTMRGDRLWKRISKVSF